MTVSPRALELTVAAAEAAADKLADDILAFDVSEQLVITDVFVLCSASNDRQVRSVVDGIEERLRTLGAKPVRREGEREGRWVLLDYIDIIVHVQHAEERIYYSLERIWKDCPAVELPDEVRQRRTAGSALRASDGSGVLSAPTGEPPGRPLAARSDGLEPRGPLPGQHGRRARRRGPGPGRPGGPAAGDPGAGGDRVLRPRPGPRHRRDAGRLVGLEVRARPAAARDVRRRWQGRTVDRALGPGRGRPTPRGGPVPTCRPAGASGAPRSRPGSVPAIVEAARRAARPAAPSSW